jgi:hypothetical protein
LSVPGYSTRTLAQKLGIKSRSQIIALAAPSDYAELLGRLPDGVILRPRLTAHARFIHFFARERRRLEDEFPQLAKALADDGVLWISWPKSTSKVQTDLTENVVRELGLPLGLVDVKVCAVNEVWSGLKFVRRVSERAKPT